MTEESSVANPVDGVSTSSVASPKVGLQQSSVAEGQGGPSTVRAGPPVILSALVPSSSSSSSEARHLQPQVPSKVPPGPKPSIWARPELQWWRSQNPPGQSSSSLAEIADRIRGLSREEVLQILEAAGHSQSRGQEPFVSQAYERPSSSPPLPLQGWEGPAAQVPEIATTKGARTAPLFANGKVPIFPQPFNPTALTSRSLSLTDRI